MAPWEDHFPLQTSGFATSMLVSRSVSSLPLPHRLLYAVWFLATSRPGTMQAPSSSCLLVKLPSLQLISAAFLETAYVHVHQLEYKLLQCLLCSHLSGWNCCLSDSLLSLLLLFCRFSAFASLTCFACLAPCASLAFGYACLYKRIRWLGVCAVLEGKVQRSLD